jgi:hypothetical protein
MPILHDYYTNEVKLHFDINTVADLDELDQHIYDPLFYGMFDTHTVSLLVCFSIQLAIFYGFPILFPATFKTPKQKSWILTTCSSITMTVASIPFMFAYLNHNSDLSLFPLLNSFVAVMFCSYFMTYLAADMLFGYIYYPEFMDPVTGW